MSKRTGSIESLIRGVSEQVPHDRFPGQTWAQDNMVSDPVRGLARRHGSRMVTEKLSASIVNSAATQSDAASYKEFSCFIAGVEYAVFYRPLDKVAGSTFPGLVVVNKDTGAILDVVTAASDNSAVVSALDSGVCAITNIAKYVLMAVRNRGATCTTTDTVASSSAASAVWIKGGAYSRTYTMSVLKTDGSKVTRSYTTPASYYQGTLNTSDIPATATDYQKQVNDRVYAYQSAVNQYIATAAAAIQPQSIATQLWAQFAGTGISGGVTQGHVFIFDANTIGVEGDDGGDGTLLKAVGQEVESANDLCPIMVPGKVVRIRPRQGTKDGIYYVKSVAKDGNQALGSGFKPVSWQECPGVLIAPTYAFLTAQIIGNTFYVATNTSILGTISGDSNQTPFAQSSAGDLDSQPIPEFMTGSKAISYMANFQDRLMIVTGSTVFLSRSGDYFNWFRQSALSVLDDDPIEVYALGSNGDTITDAVPMDRSLILFGKQQQYAMDGRQAMTPKNAFVATQSQHEDTTTCPPVGSGNYIFFSQLRNNRLTMQQMQTGDYADSFRAFDISTQLDGYLNGTPRQIVALTSPSWLVIRTKEFTNGFYTFSYLDSADQSQRLFDSWSRWTFSDVLGTLFGITGHNGNILAMTLRASDTGVYLCLDRFTREATLDDWPYLDSMRAYGAGSTIHSGWPGGSQTAAVYTKTATNGLWLVGDLLTNVSDVIALGGGTSNLALGTLYNSFFEPTAPYIRDQKDKAVLDGRLTLTTYKFTLANSAAMRAYLYGNDQTILDAIEILDWIYRPTGSWVLNTQQIADTVTLPVHPMQEIRDFRLRLQSRNWLPLTFSACEWAGQFFSQRRA